ncbi:hypothetical protein L2E82_33308 [Cichorium intybus]|uniref:Uncharacterized protein n=1 Tax=Cichorium intybus TaxID=13427 RepID=A0ACB9BJT0_CICIN|nr:hypothetical protein L2E82_33308 [Cichorium intybus]
MFGLLQLTPSPPNRRLIVATLIGNRQYPLNNDQRRRCKIVEISMRSWSFPLHFVISDSARRTTKGHGSASRI